MGGGKKNSRCLTTGSALLDTVVPEGGVFVLTFLTRNCGMCISST